MNSSSPFGNITEVAYIKDRLLFPISWLHKQDFCEYQIYIENVKGIKVKPTKAMTEGKQEHDALFKQFAIEAKPATIEEILTESKKVKVLSREFRVEDIIHGVFGYIDEVWLTPESFVVIDDKPGTKTFLSNIHQIYGYCLAFKTIIEAGDNRQVIAALREKGTNNVYWNAPFNQPAEEEIVAVVNRIHDLLSGKEQFQPTNNPNKCRSCKLNNHCDHAIN